MGTSGAKQSKKDFKEITPTHPENEACEFTPENQWLEDAISFGDGLFSGDMLNFHGKDIVWKGKKSGCLKMIEENPPNSLRDLFSFGTVNSQI